MQFVHTQNTGVIIGALGFRNEFDGHTLEPALKQVKRIVGKAPKKAAVDRGYRGTNKIGDTQILIPKSFNGKTQTKYQHKKLKRHTRKEQQKDQLLGILNQTTDKKETFTKELSVITLILCSPPLHSTSSE